MKVYSIREVSVILSKHEETIKRWARAGKFPNGYIKNDKEGWRIPEGDLVGFLNTNNNEQPKILPLIEEPKKVDAADELIVLAFEAVTLSNPTEEILNLLTTVGLKRTLEILFIYNQSSTKIKNPYGFIKKAIENNWSSSTGGVKMPKNKSKAIYEITQEEYILSGKDKEENDKEVLYNWLEK